jgi:hypothetical protein
LIFIMSALLMVSWQTPALTIGWYLAIHDSTRWPPLLRDLSAGVALTFVFYLFFPSDQGHGWGYRYAYAVLPGFVLLAVQGWRTVATTVDSAMAGRALVASLGFTLIAQVPLRFVQVEQIVRPFARAHAYIHALPADLVVVPTESLWYGRDLVRNDPFLQVKPLIAGYPPIDERDFRNLPLPRGVRVRVVQIEELLALGMERVYSPVEGRTHR